MNPQPKRLALLISLIGVGVAPGAWARSELRVVRDMPSLQDLAVLRSPAVGLAPDDADGLPWVRDLDLGVSGRWLLQAAPHDGTSGDDPLPDAGGSESSSRSETAPTDDDDLSQRADLGGAGAMPELAAAVATDTDEVVRAEPPAQALPDDAPAPSARVLRTLAEVAAAPREPDMVADAPSTTDRVDGREESEGLSRDARPNPLDVPLRDAVEIVVDTPSNKVLRLLEAIRSDERDEVGAAIADVAPKVVATQSDKVLATLEAIVSAPRTAGVDIELPLEPPVVGAAPLESRPATDAPASTPVDVPPAPTMQRPRPFGDQHVALGEEQLAGVRGGFVGDGLNVSFGIERAVYVNGVLVTTTSLNLSNLDRMTAGRETALFDAGTIALIQSGAGNVVKTSGAMSSAAMGTVVQNTLDGQKIQSVTVINASTNAMGVLRNLNFQSSLRSAVIDSLRR